MSPLTERLLSLCDELLCTADARGHFVDLSPAWERVLGWSLAELRERPFLDFVHPADRDATLAASARLAGGSDLVRFENRYHHRDGSFRTLAWTALAPPSAGELLCARARDVTDQAPATAPSAADLQRRIEQQEALLGATATPIIEVWDDILTMPVVGLVDSVRASDMKSSLLAAVARTGAKYAIVDVTGVDTVDTATADHLLKVMRAVHLLGARCVLTGIQPTVARIIVGLGLDLQSVTTLRSLREGLRFCLRQLGVRVERPPADPGP